MHITTRGLIVSIIFLVPILSAFFTKGAEAGVYVDIGVAVHEYNARGFQQTENRKLGQDIGIVEIGIKKGNWTVFYLHESVISQYDAGLDMVGVKYRIVGD